MLSSPRLEPLSGGLLHQTWAVHDPGGAFILQRVADAFSPAVHDNVEAVTKHLARRGAATFELIRTGEGGILWRDDECDHRLMTRLPGEAFEVCPAPELARSAAAALARFHSALADFETPLAGLGFAYREPDVSFAALERALREHVDHPFHTEVATLASQIGELRAAWPLLGELPARVIHGDLKFSNVLFIDGEAHALIDLDTVLRRPLYHDLGDAWRSWCNPRPEDDPEARLDLDIFEASAAGYLEALSFELTTPERDSLTTALERVALELSARFATDTLQETWFGWDPARFKRSADHQLLRAKAQLNLANLAKQAHPRIQATLANLP